MNKFQGDSDRFYKNYGRAVDVENPDLLRTEDVHPNWADFVELEVKSWNAAWSKK